MGILAESLLTNEIISKTNYDIVLLHNSMFINI